MMISLRSISPFIATGILIGIVAGCASNHIRLQGQHELWQAENAKNVRELGGGEVQLLPGRLIAEGFSWAGSEIEFRIYDPKDTVFSIYLLDHTFSEVRKKNAASWHDMIDNRRVPMSQSPNRWRLDIVHELGVGGDSELYAEGRRLFGGNLTTQMGVRGLPERSVQEIFSEKFRINDWNHIRIQMRNGLLRVWVNGEEGPSVQTDRRLNGTFGFGVFDGELRIADVKLTKL